MVWVCLSLDYDFGGDRVEAYKKLWAPCNIDYDYINSITEQLNYKEQTNNYNILFRKIIKQIFERSKRVTFLNLL